MLLWWWCAEADPGRGQGCWREGQCPPFLIPKLESVFFYLCLKNSRSFFALHNPLQNFKIYPQGGTPTNFIWRCSAERPDPLPFHILNFGKSGHFYILNFEDWHPFTYLSLRTYPFYIPPAWKRDPFPITWIPKRYRPFWAEHLCITHYREHLSDPPLVVNGNDNTISHVFNEIWYPTLIFQCSAVHNRFGNCQ